MKVDLNLKYEIYNYNLKSKIIGQRFSMKGRFKSKI